MKIWTIRLCVLSFAAIWSNAGLSGFAESASAPLPQKISAPQLQRDDCVGDLQSDSDGFSPYIEEFVLNDTRHHVSLYSCVNWQEGFLKSEGVGKKGSRRAAELVARGNALKTLIMLNLHADARFQEYFNRQTQVRLTIQNVLIQNAGIQEMPADPKQPDDVKVMVHIPFYGVSGLTSFLLDAQEMSLEPLTGKSAPSSQEPPSSDEFTGIILDVRHIPAMEPALFPIVLSEEGEVLYRASQVKKDILKNQGMVDYVREDDLKISGRTGERPLIIRPLLLASADDSDLPYLLLTQAQTRKRRRKGNSLTVEATGNNGQIPVNVVVSVEDARKIKQLNDQYQIDQEGKYTILIGGEIGGVQGWNRNGLYAMHIRR